MDNLCALLARRSCCPVPGDRADTGESIMDALRCALSQQRGGDYIGSAPRSPAAPAADTWLALVRWRHPLGYLGPAKYSIPSNQNEIILVGCNAGEMGNSFQRSRLHHRRCDVPA